MKRAVITGGAGGLGRAFARQLLERGFEVSLWDIDRAALEATAKELDSEAVSTRVVDASDRSAVQNAASEEVPPDLLVLNAGVVTPGEFTEGDDEGLERTIRVNLDGVVWGARSFLPAMRERDSGHIIFIASASGFTGVPGMAVYSATKHAVVGLADSIRHELKKSGSKVGVTIVCPSFISTGMFDGCEPPKGSDWLSAEEVAAASLRAFDSGRTFVLLPGLSRLLPFLRVLPTGISDRLLTMLGAHRSLEGLHGRG